MTPTAEAAKIEAVRAVFVMLLAILSCAQVAQADSKLDDARNHFRAGEALYQLGRYQDAAHEFEAGFELAPRPSFLINMGQAYRKLKDPAKALELFQKYLNATGPTDRRRAEVQKMVDELRGEIAAAPPAPVVVAPPVEVAPSPAPVAVIAPAPLVTETRAADKPKKSFVSRHWWIFPVAVVVVGTAVGLGVYYGTHTGNRFDCANTISCIDTLH